MRMERDNSLLFKGMLILGFGLILCGYSLFSYLDIKNFAKNVDFELVDGNIEMTAEEKYYKYITFADYINQKLNKNKSLPIKTSSCTYLNYAEHNALELYRITTTSLSGDISKVNFAKSNIRDLNSIIDSYSTCKSYPEFKTELKDLISEIENEANSDIDNEIKMQKFLNDFGENLVENENAQTTDGVQAEQQNVQPAENQTFTNAPAQSESN
jgi:hypothetical protein